MTTKPTLGANHGVSTGLTSTEWNRDVLQQGNWTQEVIAGSNADKLANNAFATNSIGGDRIVDATVTNAKLATGLDGAKLTNATVDGTKLATIVNIGSRTVMPSGGSNGVWAGIAHFFENLAYTFLTSNIWHDGTNYQRDDTSKPGWAIQMGGAGDYFNVIRWAAGANPATGNVSPFFVDANGVLGGTGFYDSAEFTVTTGATVSLLPGWNVPARFVFGIWGTASGVERSPMPFSTATLTGQVRISGTPYDNIRNNINVTNDNAATTYCRVWAMR